MPSIPYPEVGEDISESEALRREMRERQKDAHARVAHLEMQLVQARERAAVFNAAVEILDQPKAMAPEGY